LFLGLGTACAGLLALHTLKARPREAASLPRVATSRGPDRLASEAATPVAPGAAPLPAVAPSVVPPPAAPPDASVAATTANEAPAATAPTRPAPTPAELRAAVLATPISMYTAPWCGTCRRAHAFLQANGLTCKDIDIDENPAALRELKARSGGTSIPVIDVDGKLLRAGFSERAVERALTDSVERRLGLTGVELRASSL
jgi:glutaredoxin